MSDPHPKRWLADDPNFLASLSDLDRGLAAGDAIDDVEAGEALTPVPESLPDAVAPPPPVPLSARRSTARPINAARALDPARVLDTDPRSRPVRMEPPAPRELTLGAPAPPPPLAFARPVSPEPRARRPLLDLFPAAALEPDLPPPPPSMGTAVGPQLPSHRPRHAPKPDPAAPSPPDALTYETFYGLREKPFSLSTDPRFHYPSAAHERAAHDLLGAMRARTGPAILTGRLGMGKTTLCRALVPQIDRRTITSLVLEPVQSIDDLLKTVLADFGVLSRDDLAGAPHPARDVMTHTLTSFLESLVPLQASAVLFIDEAQNVPVTVLGDLAVLLRAGGSASHVLQLVLVGQPSLASVLKHPDLRGLNASVTRRTELGPLNADEVTSYVRHRLSIAGANTRIEFDDAAVALLFELSEGAPRVINLLCDRAMTRGQASSAAVIDAALIAAAAGDLDLEAPAGEGRGVLETALAAVLFLLLVLAGAAAALYVSRDAVHRTVLQWENVPLPPGGPVRRLPVPLAPIPPPDL